MNSAYIETTPKEIVFVLNHDDGSQQLKVEYTDCKELEIIQGNDKILLPVTKIEWLRQVLKDIDCITQMNKEKG